MSEKQNIFEAVKQSVTPRQAASFYGQKVSRQGMCLCPFHDDRNPSMKLYHDHFYCFGCGQAGDVIDFTAKLYSLTPKEAAKKLTADFGIIYEESATQKTNKRSYRKKTGPTKRKESTQEKLDRAWNRCWRVYCEYMHLLSDWNRRFRPDPETVEWDPRFVESFLNLARVNHLLDLLWNGSSDEKLKVIKETAKEVTELEKRLEEYRSGTCI